MDATTGLFDKIDILTTNLASSASRNDKTGRISRELVAEIASSGVLALTVPKASGRRWRWRFGDVAGVASARTVGSFRCADFVDALYSASDHRSQSQLAETSDT